MIRFQCKKCRQKIRTSDQHAGKKSKCPKCKTPLVIPKRQIQIARNSKTSSAEPNPRKTTSGYTPQELTAMSNEQIARKLLGKNGSAEAQEPKTKTIFKSFVPRYDETTLFLMSIIFIVIFITTETMRTALYYFMAQLFGDRDWRSPIGIIFLLICFVAGLCLSIFHAFSTRKKTELEKAAMLFFAVPVTAGIGIYAGIIMLEKATNWLIIFPVWNIIYGVLLLIFFRFNIIDERCINDRNTTHLQVILGLVATIIIFITCQYFFKLHWAITYSICIAYTTSLDKAVQSIFGQRSAAL